ncbi:ABC-type transport system substrate-binding protein [Microbacterium resistens]|uniref:ABC-type transport system substrate-binding protein n=1 Tax=Microbacterium resistens TaxID=156977 RepID=A0ABU1S9D7_9MICO|nr:ABC transporter substrate-binding protein [Microbacterium resistens]MDR6866222.1 ABC-type transport system substrate-binding protein [Microbacterium resistens]
MRLLRNRLLAVSIVAAASLTFAGCSAASGPTSGGSSTPSAQTASTENPVFAQAVQITSLAPMGKQPQGYPSGYEAAFAIYDGLVRLGADMTFQPDLAESWETSADGLTWTFRLREGVTFHDGASFSSANVVDYFTRMLDPEYNLSAYSLWAPIASVAAVDANTVAITTKKPYAALLNTLAHGSALIPSIELVAAGEAKATLDAVGTGAYELKTFEPGSTLVLAANEDYFGEKPQYETITYSYVGDASGRLAGLQAGQADVVGSVPVEQAKALESSPQTRVISFPGLQAFGIGMSQANPLLADPTVRQALNAAVDVDAIVKAVLRGFAEPLTSPLAARTNGHTDVGKPSYDKDKALSLLKEAGFQADGEGKLSKDGKPFTLRLRTPDGMYANDVLVAQAVQAQLADLGIDVEIQKVDKSTFWAGIKVAKSAVDYDLVLFGFNPSHGSGALQLDIMYRSNPTEDAVNGWNFTWYSNPEADALIDQAMTTVDVAAQQKAMDEAQKIVWDDAPYIWLYSPNILVGYNDKAATPVVLPVGFVLPSRTS